MNGEAVLAGPPSTLYRLRKLARRHRVSAAALAVVAIAVTVGVAASMLSLLRAVRAEDLARRQLRESLLNQARSLTNSNQDQELRVWNLSARTDRLVVKAVRSLSFGFAPDSSQLVASCSEGHVHLFHLTSGREVSRKQVGPLTDVLAVHPTQPLVLVSGYARGEIEIRRADDGAFDRRLDVPAMGLAAEWSADGRSLITTHLDFSIRVWDWPSMHTPRLILRYHRAEPVTLATDPTGRWLATGGWDNHTAFFDLRDGRLLLSQPGTTVYAARDRSASSVSSTLPASTGTSTATGRPLAVNTASRSPFSASRTCLGRVRRSRIVTVFMKPDDTTLG